MGGGKTTFARARTKHHQMFHWQLLQRHRRAAAQRERPFTTFSWESPHWKRYPHGSAGKRNTSEKLGACHICARFQTTFPASRRSAALMTVVCTAQTPSNYYYHHYYCYSHSMISFGFYWFLLRSQPSFSLAGCECYFLWLIVVFSNFVAWFFIGFFCFFSGFLSFSFAYGKVVVASVFVNFCGSFDSNSAPWRHVGTRSSGNESYELPGSFKTLQDSKTCKNYPSKEP